MLTKEISEVEKEIEKIEERYKNCGFVFNHSSRETDGTHKKNLGNNTRPLYVWDWTCGKEVSICPRCKNRLNTNSKLKTLKQKLSTLKSAQQKFDGLNEKLKIIDYRIKEMESNYKDMHIPLHIQFLFDEWKEVRDELSPKQAVEE
jgi:uncharacterized protein YdcH (DUF465 family)